MDIVALEQLIRAATKKKVKVTKVRSLLAGGDLPEATSSYEGPSLKWDQRIEEKYRCGFYLWQKVRVTKGDNKGFVGYVAGWNPYPEYTLILISNNKGSMSPRFGFRNDELEDARE